MGRPRRTDRHEGTESHVDERDNVRDDDRDDHEAFEQSTFADAAESPLHIPPEEWPEGMTLRWIRIEAGNAADNTNWAKMSRIGWSPVPRKMFAKRFPSTPMPGADQSTTDQVIIFGGLCLCQRPRRLVERDRKRIEQDTADAGRTIETYVEGGNPNFPRKDFGSSNVQYERGVRPAQFKE